MRPMLNNGPKKGNGTAIDILSEIVSVKLLLLLLKFHTFCYRAFLLFTVRSSYAYILVQQMP